MTTTKLYILFLFCVILNVHAQNDQKETLEEVILNSTRIEVPFSKSSKNISIITSKDIKQSTATNLTDLLQSLSGIDVIKRGSNGMQADIKIRGGNFEQTLILIDGIKTEDPQTGHHTMNMMIPLDNIERIEIIKGAAARVYGQNAFTGAINIVTKKNSKNKISLNVNYGSYNYLNGGIVVSKKFKKSSHFITVSHQQSDGYRKNTDFKNNNIFLKSKFKTHKEPITLIASFANRDFGAQYFYTSPASSFTEYEETQTSLVGIATKYHFSKLTLKPKVYWKRNQDMFLLKREDPSFSENFNISNKIGLELNSNYKSYLGITGFGVDVAKVSLASNNLGNQDRTMVNVFAEHRFVTKNNKLDFTPGIAMSYFSDFGTGYFPGLDVGYKVNGNTQLFWNVGSSYRVPSYTEMYINIPSFLSGNPDLKPEKAVTQEIGMKFKNTKLSINTAIFHRVANDLIDYVKETATSPFFRAENLRTITTNGFELSGNYNFIVSEFKQQLNMGYTYLLDDYGTINVFQSRYLLDNSIKHHFTTSLNTQFFKYISQSVSYRYVERPINKYHVLDAKLNINYKSFNVFVLVNNILDTDYYEKMFIPMPKSNFEIGVKYKF